MSWRDYWNSDTPIYVNDRHKRVHYARIADDLLALGLQRHWHVLDYGSGEALSADRVAREVGTLYLSDGAPLVCDRLRGRFSDIGNIRVLLPEEMAAIAAGSLDLVVVNSLIQYLKRDELERLLGELRRKLKPDGRLLLADVIPRDVGPLTDALALLRLAAGNGFLLAALAGLVRTALSDYARTRAALGLSTYAEPDILAMLAAAGFAARRHHPNLGHNQARMAFMATPVA